MLFRHIPRHFLAKMLAKKAMFIFCGVWSLLFWASTQYHGVEHGGGDWFWSRTALAAGAWGSALTGHFVHWDAQHAQFNILAWCLCLFLGHKVCSVKIWLIDWLFLSVFISVGLYIFCPALQLYGGASGILHGLLLEWLAWRAITEKNIVFYVLVGFLIIKILCESWLQMPVFSWNKPNFTVIFAAHMLGAVGGLILFLFRYYSQIFAQKSYERRKL